MLLRGSSEFGHLIFACVVHFWDNIMDNLAVRQATQSPVVMLMVQHNLEGLAFAQRSYRE
jgi:hypothetical protein